jgi:hypothetical protein
VFSGQNHLESHQQPGDTFHLHLEKESHDGQFTR